MKKLEDKFFKALQIIFPIGVLFAAIWGTYSGCKQAEKNKTHYVEGQFRDNRELYYDKDRFIYRAYLDTTEVNNYLNKLEFRVNLDYVVVNTGGVLQEDGSIRGGANEMWHYDGGVDNKDLKPLK